MQINKALSDFVINADRDHMECDKMFLHLNRLKFDTGYGTYLIDAEQSGATPLTFEEWLRGQVNADKKTVELPMAVRFGFGNLGVVPFKYEGINAGCVAVYNPQEKGQVGDYHTEITGKDIENIDPLIIFEFYDAVSISVWKWALEEASRLLEEKTK